ncbi:MAG TPA: sugar ABC transporter permease [Lachnospiraceae bacterium]|jgi:raffinose/stachyose/melibiose transport system permease protein|nr:aBC transporter permease protein [Firmicutes bacterium CAG:95]HCH97344.1 sugar ABC transporter permease [Lachnospiraceae bacterium]
MHWLSKKSTKIIMIMPAVILFTVFFLAPIFISVYYSFTDFSGIGAAKFIGFKNYQVLLKDKFFFIALKNTFIILIGITITILPLSFIVALLLEKPFRGSGVVQSMIFAPNVIAPILVGLIWLFILDPKMGMINAILRSIGLSDYQQQWIGGKTLTPYSVAFVYLWQVLGFYTTINMAGLRSIPADIYEAAEIDGANYFQRIRKITIPMMKNTIVINTILIITGGFKIFETVKQLTNGGPNHMSDVLVTYMYDTTFTSSRYGYGMAVATVSFVLCLIFSIIYLVNVGKSLEQKEG